MSSYEKIIIVLYSGAAVVLFFFDQLIMDCVNDVYIVYNESLYIRRN